MMACVGVGAGCRILWAEVLDTGWDGGFSCIGFAGTMVALGGNAGGVRIGTLRDGAEQSVWSASVGASRGVFGVTAVGGVSVTFEKMRESVCMAAN